MMNLAHQYDHGPLIFSRNAPTVRALKADTLPPLWWRDTLQLAAILRAAWRVETADYFKRLAKSFEKQDAQAIERALDELPDIGPRVVKRLGKVPDAIMLNVQQKAHAFWALHGQEAGVDTGLALKRDYEENYQRKLAEVAATQVKTFTQAHPERIVNDEIKRQVAYLNESKLTRAGDVARLNQRLERITSQKHNFEGMSSVHVSRLWQADGVMLAAENGVATLIGTGPTDQKCCPVCLHLVGIEVNVTDAVAKIRGDMGVTDPDEYVGAWRFPRIKDIDNMSPQEVAAHVGPLPFPAHLRCRHSYTWGTLSTGRAVSSVASGRMPAKEGAKLLRGKSPHETASAVSSHLSQVLIGHSKPYDREVPDAGVLGALLNRVVPKVISSIKKMFGVELPLIQERTAIQTVQKTLSEANAVKATKNVAAQRAMEQRASKIAAATAKKNVKDIITDIPAHMSGVNRTALTMADDGLSFATSASVPVNTGATVTAMVTTTATETQTTRAILKHGVKAAMSEVKDAMPDVFKIRMDRTSLFRGVLGDPPQGKSWRWLQKDAKSKGYWGLVDDATQYYPKNDPKALTGGFLPNPDKGKMWKWIAGRKKKDGTLGKGYWRQVNEVKGKRPPVKPTKPVKPKKPVKATVKLRKEKPPVKPKKPSRQRLDDSTLFTQKELMVKKWADAGVRSVDDANKFNQSVRVRFAKDLHEHGIITLQEYRNIALKGDLFPKHAQEKYARFLKRIESKRPDDFTQWPDGFHWDAKNNRFVVYRRKKFKDYKDVDKWLEKHGISELGAGVEGAWTTGTQKEIMTNIGVTRHLKRYMSTGVDRPVSKFTWKSNMGAGSEDAAGLYRSGTRGIDVKSSAQARLPLRPKTKATIKAKRNKNAIEREIAENKKEIQRIRDKLARTRSLSQQDQENLLECLGRNNYLERAKRQVVSSNRQFYEDVIVHEYGHHWHYGNDVTIREIFGVGSKDWHGAAIDRLKSKKAASVWAPSEYGATNFTETIAESYMRYFSGQIDMLHPDIVKLFDCLFPELQFGRRMLPGVFGPVMKNSNEVAAKLALIKKKIQDKAKGMGLFDANPSRKKMLSLN